MRKVVLGNMTYILLVTIAAAAFGPWPILVLKIVSLFVLLWFVPVILFKGLQHDHVSWDTLATTAAAGSAFAWSMGWLS